jgi:hypothetical protein
MFLNYGKFPEKMYNFFFFLGFGPELGKNKSK